MKKFTFDVDKEFSQNDFTEKINHIEEPKVYDLIVGNLYLEFPTRSTCIYYIHKNYPGKFCDKFLIDHLDTENNIDVLLAYNESERLCDTKQLIYADILWEYTKDYIMI